MPLAGCCYEVSLGLPAAGRGSALQVFNSSVADRAWEELDCSSAKKGAYLQEMWAGPEIGGRDPGDVSGLGPNFRGVWPPLARPSGALPEEAVTLLSMS